MPDVAFWQGNEALAHGALAAGCRFFAGYPITPSTEIAEIMAEELPKLNGRFIQMEDEIAGIAATIGGSIAGRKALTATSGPGFSLKQENLGFAYIAEIPIVVVDVMRGGPSTGLPTRTAQQDVMQARWGTHGDHGTICYAPSSVQECYEIAIKAFNAAERYRHPRQPKRGRIRHPAVLVDAAIADQLEVLCRMTRRGVRALECVQKAGAIERLL
ncbi:MAG TPA: hypothetical protein PK849_04140, partial [Synergistales bacterium]|nr:hypothetical protein [Synergistales bacterium]